MSKNDNKQGFAENNGENEKKNLQEFEEKKTLKQKNEEKKREEYEKNLAEERVELLKLKQGVISESDKLQLSPDEEKQYTKWQKFKNFIYHSKWWLGVAGVIVCIAVFLVYDNLTTVRPDVIAMLLSNDQTVYEHYEGMETYLNELIEDYNGDHKTKAGLIYIPMSEKEEENMVGTYETSASKLSNQLRTGDTMIVIADSKSDKFIFPDDLLVDLEKFYPDNPNVKGVRFYLKGTGFAKKIGYTEGDVPDDLYIGIRKVTNSFTPEDEMQEHYEYAMMALDALVNDLP